jgi:hypothetical protein
MRILFLHKSITLLVTYPFNIHYFASDAKVLKRLRL